MFSGIVQEIGIVKSIKSSNGILNIEISCGVLGESTKDLKEGHSIAVNGCCQTAVEITQSSFIVQATEETLNKTNFKNFKVGSQVNLETPLKIGDKISGHMVSGHVDAACEISEIISSGDNKIVKINFPKELRSHIVSKGSITVNGVSLTVVNSQNNSFSVCIIPYTFEHTNFKTIKPGSIVNIEFDILGKYISRLLPKG